MSNAVANIESYQTDANGYSGGFGNGSQGEVDNLQKALEATHMTGGQSAGLTGTSGAALKFESLDPTMKILTHTQANIVLWKNIPKKTAHSTTEEYNVMSSYGQERGGFNREGELPMEEDSVYNRKSQMVKYLGVTKSVTHQMLLVSTQGGDVMQREVTNGTLWIMRKMEKALTKGDANLIGEEFNGLYAQHERNDFFTTRNDYFNSEVVIDCRGSQLTEALIEAAAEGIVENYGFGTKLYATPKALSNFVENFYGNKFIPVTGGGNVNTTVGQSVQDFQSQYGKIALEWSVFMNPEAPRLASNGATSALAPAAPTATGATPVTVIGAGTTNSKFASSDAGNYFYLVTSFNRHGESAGTVLSAAAASAIASGAVDLAFAATAGPNGNPTGYAIYRSLRGATSAASAQFYQIFKVSATELAIGYDGAAAGAVRDLNRFMTMTSEAFLIQNDESVFEFAELCPLLKMDLAINGPSMRFMLLQYGTPLMYAPKRMVRFINIGQTITAAANV